MPAVLSPLPAKELLLAPASLALCLFPQPPSRGLSFLSLPRPVSVSGRCQPLCLFPYFLLGQIEVPLILASLGGVTGLDLTTLSERPSCPGDLWVES